MPTPRHPLETASLLHLTTTGRRTGQPRRVEVSFVYVPGQVYLLAHARAGGRGTDWYRNLQAQPRCVLEVAGHSFAGEAVFPPDPAGFERAVRARFRARYGDAAYERRYAHTARLPVLIRLQTDVD